MNCSASWACDLWQGFKFTKFCCTKAAFFTHSTYICEDYIFEQMESLHSVKPGFRAHHLDPGLMTSTCCNRTIAHLLQKTRA